MNESYFYKTCRNSDSCKCKCCSRLQCFDNKTEDCFQKDTTEKVYVVVHEECDFWGESSCKCCKCCCRDNCPNNQLKDNFAPIELHTDKNKIIEETKQYCLSISSAKFQSCLGAEGCAALLPHRIPQNAPKNWSSIFEGDKIIPDELDSAKGFVYEDEDSDEDEYQEVIPLNIAGLVYIKDLCFMYNGKAISPMKEGSPIKWDSKNEVYRIEIA